MLSTGSGFFPALSLLHHASPDIATPFLQHSGKLRGHLARLLLVRSNVQLPQVFAAGDLERQRLQRLASVSPSE